MGIGLDEPQDHLDRIRFFRACAGQWRSLAQTARDCESQETCLQIEALWEELASECERVNLARTVALAEEAHQLVAAAQ